MKILLLLSLLLFTSLASAAKFIAFVDPYYYFDVDGELYLCQLGKQGVFCKHTVNGVTANYKCKKVPNDEGYLKDCAITPGKKLEGLK
jgi:beta-xylosidase